MENKYEISSNQLKPLLDVRTCAQNSKSQIVKFIIELEA